MRREPIIIGLGVLIILLALTGTGSSRSVYGGNCQFCHVTFTQPVNLTPVGSFFKEIHRFDGTAVPTTADSCTECHVAPPTTDLNLTSTGQNYSSSHRYNDTTLASARLGPPACYNCHVDVNGSNFTLLTGSPTYLKSNTCENCHKEKYDNWTGTMHRVMLTNSTNAQTMNLPLPSGFGWENISFMIVGKSEMRYLNDSGYLFEEYDAVNQTFAPLNSSQYTCGRCHTTGYSPSGNQSNLSGIVGTWSEPGIACERCHGPGGNGHQVEANVSEQVCLQCHNGSTRQGTFLSSAHSPPLEAPTECLRCHSPFDYAKNRTVTPETAINVVCASCHNPHNTSDDQYRELLSPGGFNATMMADVKDAKNSLFNSSASREAGRDIYDTLRTPALIYDRDASYPGPINVTGPISEVLCSNCHYNHGLAHVGDVNLTHARKNYPGLGLQPATCIDCHMADGQKNHSFNVKDENNFPSATCSRGTECHVTSDQNLNHSRFSVVPEVREWRSSGHNNTAFVLEGAPENTSRCAQCHSPINWNPMNASETIAPEDFKGVTCAICHNIHDMGDWLTKTEQIFGVEKPYAWYTRDAYNRTSFFRANYSIEANTTELCTNCHHNRPDTSTPGWTGRGPHGAVVPHISPQKDMFLGSFKDSNLKFECATCHMYSKTIDPTNLTEPVLPDNQKIAGHSFRVNATGLQSDGSWNNQSCSSCHVNGSSPGTVGEKINNVQADIQNKWNDTNTTVENAWNTYNASTGEKNLSGTKLAEAFFKLYMVKNDGSWGVHNPQKAIDLLNDSARLADEANASLGQNETRVTFNISGFKVNDTNGNNVWDSGEMGIENWNINLLNHTTSTQIANTSTNASGFYQFTNLTPGIYNVTEETKPGFTPTGAVFKVVTIENMDIMDVDFLNKVTVTPTPTATPTVTATPTPTPTPTPTAGSISGFKVNDLNGNGRWDKDEAGLADWNIRLIGTGVETVGINKETTTDDRGFYSFENLTAGRYIIIETLKVGFVPTSAPVKTVTVAEGKNSANNNFTNRPISRPS